MNDIGVTGSRKGPTIEQLSKTFDLLKNLYIIHKGKSTLHHGCCTGYDAKATAIAWAIGYRITGHPPVDETFLSKIALSLSYDIMDPDEYLSRNKDIVNKSEIIIAAPETVEEKSPRSGTWYTIRYAKGLNKSGTIIWPDGSTELL